ncbi:Ruditapes philippinarum AP-1 protein mRNA [Elysia marginata]|uniref:Ruditapes philippinarum AP-1 protein mRNA n=1 Tax=Elysia marginata TaxID=1093978 RepID=A0AAV4EL80_9GAST|nr:Ruditapes philippinarum AP-1 protein mRNA [Elysia marginata]
MYLSFSTSSQNVQLTALEIAKRERRKEQNRRAAKKCRGKKKEKQAKAQQEVCEALKRKDFLEKEVVKLRGDVCRLQSQLKQHEQSGCCLLAMNPACMPDARNMIPNMAGTAPDDSLIGHTFLQSPPCQSATVGNGMQSPSTNRPVAHSVPVCYPAHSSRPSPSPVRRSCPSDNQVVPSVSPSLSAVEMSPRTPHGYPQTGGVRNWCEAVPTVFHFDDNAVASMNACTLPEPYVSTTSGNSVSESAIDDQTNNTPHANARREMPSVFVPNNNSNNLPSWDLSNVQPSNLIGLDGVDLIQHITISDKMTDGEATFTPQPDLSLESLARSCVPPNAVQPQVSRTGTTSNDLSSQNPTPNNCHLQCFEVSTTNTNNNINSSIINNNSFNNNNNIVFNNNNHSPNTGNYVQLQHIPSSIEFTRCKNLFGVIDPFCSSS